MDLESITVIVTAFVTLIFGFIAKKNPKINDNLIPIQNLTIGVVVAIVEWIITKDFSFAIAASGLFAGGIYDLGHNTKKIIG